MCVVVYFANPANLTLSCEIEQTMLTVDSLEIKARQKATIALIRKYGCDDTADAVTQELYFGWKVKSRQGQSPGAAIPMEMELGVVCDPFLPKTPLISPPTPGVTQQDARHHRPA